MYTSDPRRHGVSVVICCYNSAQRLPETLKHLARQKMSALVPWEVIIVNNASTDETAGVATRVWSAEGCPIEMRIVEERKPGLSHAREAGISNARCGIVIFADDDNWLAPNYISIAHEVMEQHPRIGAIGAFISPKFEVPPPPWFCRMQSYYAIGPQGPREGDITDEKPHVAGAGMVMRKSAFLDLKRCGFRSLLSDRQGAILSSGGDTEICYALALAGYRVWYEPQLQLVHFIPAQRLTKSYLWKMARCSWHTNLVLACYEAAFRGSADAAFMIYCSNLLKHGRWALKSVVKFLLGRHGWMMSQFELLCFWHALVSLPELRRVFKLHMPEIGKLKRGDA